MPRVTSQDVCLRVDARSELATGHTTITAVLKEDEEVLELSCHGIVLRSVHVEGKVAEFDLKDTARESLDMDLSAIYRSSCANRLEPNLTIRIPPRSAQAPTTTEAGESHAGKADSSPIFDDLDQKLSENSGQITVSIRYALKSDSTNIGILYRSGYALTRGTTGSVSHWMPCFDAAQALQDFRVKLIVPENHVAISSGTLRKVSKLAREGTTWFSYDYNMPYICSPSDLAFAVGPFKLHSTIMLGEGVEHESCVLNHFVPVGHDIESLEHTLSFFRIPLELFYHTLGRKFPSPSMNHVMLPGDLIPEMAVSGVGFQATSVSDRIVAGNVEQSQRIRCNISAVLGKQWFGHFIRPKTMNDLWLTYGLQLWLCDLFVQNYIGRTEYLYRKWQRHMAVAEMDNGEAPPLAFHALRPEGCLWGPFYGTENMDPSHFFVTKAVAIVSMMEARAGDQLFKKQVENSVQNGFVSATQDGTTIELDQSHGRKIDSRLFFTELSKAGDFRAEVSAFIERWVYGSGAPIIALGIQFNRRGCTLDVGLKQSGSIEALNSTLAAEVEAKKEKTGMSGIIKVAVQEGSGVRVDHPLHLGSKGYLLSNVSVNPEVKKIAGKRGRKKKEEEALMAEKQAALRNAQHPVQYVRLDPSGEVLCQKHVHQPTRMVLNKLKNSRDVVSQSEAARELSALVVTESDRKALDGLAEALEDSSVHWTIRSEAAMALSKVTLEDGSSAGVHALIRYYKKKYWDVENDVPKILRFERIEDYLVANAVLLSLSKCKGPNGHTHFDSILFFKACFDNLWLDKMNLNAKSILATFCTVLGNLNCDKNEEMLIKFIHQKGFSKLLWILRKELVTEDTDMHVATSAVLAMVSLTESTCCPLNVVSEVQDILHNCCISKHVPSSVQEAALKALIRLKLTWKGCEDAISWCAELSSMPNMIPLRQLQIVWKELCVRVWKKPPTEHLQNLLKRIVCSESLDPEIKHLAFVVHAIMTSSKIFVLEPHGESKPSLIKLNAATVLEIPTGTKSASEVAAGEKSSAEPAAKKLQLSLSAIKKKYEDELPVRIKEEAGHAEHQSEPPGQTESTDVPAPLGDVTPADEKEDMPSKSATTLKVALKFPLPLSSARRPEQQSDATVRAEGGTGTMTDGDSNRQIQPSDEKTMPEKKSIIKLKPIAK